MQQDFWIGPSMSHQGGRSCAKERKAFAKSLDRTTISSHIIHYFVAILRFVAIYTYFKRFWARKFVVFFGVKFSVYCETKPSWNKTKISVLTEVCAARNELKWLCLFWRCQICYNWSCFPVWQSQPVPKVDFCKYWGRLFVCLNLFVCLKFMFGKSIRCTSCNVFFGNRIQLHTLGET